jgi:hypothetical protein
MISPGTRPRSAPEAERVMVSQGPGEWGLFAAPRMELPPPGAPFTDTREVLPMEQLLDVLGRHGLQATWWFAKVPAEEGSTGEPRYLTITYHGTGDYELRHTPSSARLPFILSSASALD